MDQITNTPWSRRGNAGILLLVVLIGLAIGLWLMFGPTGSDGSSYADKVVETKEMGEELADDLQLRSIGQVVTAYKLETGKMPESMDDIPDARVVVDRWEQEYRLRKVDDFTFEIQSPGPDGLFDTEDDLVMEGKVQV